MVAKPVPQARRRRPVLARPRQLPLRTTLLGILVFLLVIALSVSGTGTLVLLKGYLVGQVDEDLSPAQATKQIGRIISTLTSDGNGTAVYQSPLPTDYVLQLDSGADAIVGVPNERAGDSTDVPDFPDLTLAEAAAKRKHPFTMDSAAGGSDWRGVAYTVPDVNGQQHVVVLALPLIRQDLLLTQLRTLLLVLGVILVLACVLLGFIAIQRAFRPLAEVERTAAAIAAGDLSRRVPPAPPNTEVGRLTESLNTMLARIESAFHAQEASENRTRRFAADASHELRTPVTAIRGFAELYRQGAVTEPEDVTRVMQRIESEATRMGSLVEDLLLLARLDEQRPGRSEPVDLAVLAGDAVHDAHAMDPARTIRLVGLEETAGPGAAVVIGDENRLRQVVANLTANAIRHTPEGTPVEIAVGRADGTAVLEVRDHGPGLAPQDAERVFERFYRVDASRRRGTGGGSGLGLSIVAAVVDSHGGRVGVRPTAGGGATFRLELPAVQPAELVS